MNYYQKYLEFEDEKAKRREKKKKKRMKVKGKQVFEILRLKARSEK